MVHVTDHGFAGQADLNGTPRLWFQMDRPVGIPLHTHREHGDLRVPLVPVRVYTGLEVTEGRVRQRPLEPRPVDVGAEDSFLVRPPGPPGAIHHPKERRFDPRQAAFTDLSAGSARAGPAL